VVLAVIAASFAVLVAVIILQVRALL
jgi:hypothetical protein